MIARPLHVVLATYEHSDRPAPRRDDQANLQRATARSSGPRPARRGASPRRTPRHRPGWSRRCPVRRCCGAPRPTPAAGRLCDDLVPQRVEPSSRIGLGRPVERDGAAGVVRPPPQGRHEEVAERGPRRSRHLGVVGGRLNGIHDFDVLRHVVGKGDGAVVEGGKSRPRAESRTPWVDGATAHRQSSLVRNTSPR